MNRLYSLTLAGIFCTLFSCNSNNNMKAGYSGNDISNDVSIVRDKTTKAASVHIDTDGEWTVYAGRSVDNIGFDSPVAQGTGKATSPLAVPDSVRSYFQVVTDRGNAILSERHLPMTGGYNFRDLGGYRTMDGRYVKWGKMFRSDELHNLTMEDLRYLSSIPIRYVVDFRSQEEITALPDVNPSSVRKNYSYSISPGNLTDAVNIDPQTITTQQVDSLMMQMNVLLVTDSASIEQYINFFELLQNNGDTPVMFHCTAGKDRTGMAAALILASLGVDEQTIMDDYLLSNRYLDGKYAGFKAENPNLAPLLEVKPEYIRAGLDRIKQEHGSIENYLTNVLKVDISKMKELYLY